jgi:hypothetical protein
MHHPSRWSWLTLIACAAASGTAGAQGVVPSEGGQPAPATPSVPTAEGDPPAGREWRLPPLRVSGTLTYDGRVTRASGQPSTVGNVVTATVGTSTYLYAPWLATVNGQIGLSGGWTRSGAVGVGTDTGFNDSGPHERLRTREVFVTGNGRVDLFPRSRFPAEIHFDRQDSRTDSGLASALGFRRQGIGMSQRYRPANGAYDIVAAYDHREQSGFDFRHRQDSLSGDFNTRWKYHELQVGALYNRAENVGFEDSSQYTSLITRHGYTPSPELSVHSTANLTRTQENNLSDLQVLQASSLGVYRKDKSPLTLTGSVRGLALRDDRFNIESDSVGGTLGANYEYSPNLRLTANAAAAVNRSRDASATIASGGVGATYQGDALEFREFRYEWFGSGTLGGTVGDSSTFDTVVERTVGAQVGHSLNRNWRLSERSSIGASASQSLAASHSASSERGGEGSGLGASKTLLNSLSLNWQQSGDGKTGYARATYSDSMELGGGRARFQLFNFQLSGNFELGYGRSITADLTYQRSTQRSSELRLNPDPFEPSVVRTQSSGASGEVSFRQNQVFGVPRLQFVSRVRLAQDVLKQPGQFVSIPDRETRVWENRLDWNIGRLSTQLELRLSQIDGRRVNSVWLRVQRNFGD